MNSFVESSMELKNTCVEKDLLALSVEKLEKENSTKKVEIQRKKSRPRATANKFVKSKKPLSRSRKVFKAKNVQKFSTTTSPNDVTSPDDVTASPKMLIAVTQSSSLSLLSKSQETLKTWSQLCQIRRLCILKSQNILRITKIMKNGLAFQLTLQLIHETDLRCKEKRKKTNFAKIWNFFCGWKFVIFILILFTVCWLPWIAIYFGDIVYHTTGMLDVNTLISIALFHQKPILPNFVLTHFEDSRCYC